METRMRLNRFLILFPTCLGLILGSAPIDAGAQSMWDPPGDDDDCNLPWILCADKDGKTSEDEEGETPVTVAATMVGNEVDRMAEEHYWCGFIYWIAETFGPNIPKGITGDPGTGDSDDAAFLGRLLTQGSGLVLITGDRVVTGTRRFFDPVAEGTTLDQEELSKGGDARQKRGRLLRKLASKFDTKLVRKRESDPANPDEFELVLLAAPKGTLKGNSRPDGWMFLRLRGTSGGLEAYWSNQAEWKRARKKGKDGKKGKAKDAKKAG